MPPHQVLLDRWAYFWRLAVVSLCEELPPGEHVAVLHLELEIPDAAVLNRAPTGPLWESFRQQGKHHKLWLMHWLIEEQSERERAMLPYRYANRSSRDVEGRSSALTARLGGSSVATGGRRAD